MRRISSVIFLEPRALDTLSGTSSFTHFMYTWSWMARRKARVSVTSEGKLV